MLRRFGRVLCSLTATMLVAVACGGNGSTTTSSSSAKPLSVSEVSVNLAYSQLPIFAFHKWIEQDLTAAGLTVNTVAGLGGPQIVQGVLSGQVNFGGPLLSSAEAAVAAGADIEIIGLATSGQSETLVGRPGINTLKDLQGKKVGIVSVHSTGDTVVKILMAQAGLDSSSVQWVSGSGGPNALPAAKSGNIDVAVVQPPDSTMIEDTLGWHTVADMSKVNQFVYESWITSKSFAKDHPDVVQLFVDVLVKAFRREATDKAGWLQVAQQYRPNTSSDALSQAYDLFQKLNEFKFAYKPLSSDTLKDIDWTVEQMVVAGSVPRAVPAKSYVDFSFSTNTAKKLGPLAPPK